MKTKNITDSDIGYLKVADLENMFDVFTDEQGRYYYNLNETVYLNINESQLERYVVKYECQWPLISYQIYGTTRLAWLLMKVNKVPPQRMFKALRPSDEVLYPPTDMAKTIANTLNNS